MRSRRLAIAVLLSCACSAPFPAADAGADASIESGADAGLDAAVDSGVDAGIDAGSDAGADSGLDAGIDAGVDAGIDAGTRHLRLGFSPFWANEAVPFGKWSYDFLPFADFVSVHADDFFGIPFDLFISDAPSNLPKGWVDAWDALAMPAVKSGKPILLSVSVLADRSRLVKKVLADGTVVEHWDVVTDGGTPGNLCYTFAEPDTAAIATAYVHYLQWLIARYHPAQLVVSIETDVQFYKCPAYKANYQSFIGQVRDVTAALNPGLPVFMSFAFENFYANGLSASLNGCGLLTSDACFDARAKEAIALTKDAGLGLSMYPQTWYPSSAQMPLNRFTRLAALTSQPLWVTETGWGAVPLRFSYEPGTCNDSSKVYWNDALANDATHAANVAQTLALAEDAGVFGVVWWLYRDTLDEGIAATCPCAPSTSDTCQRIALFRPSDFFYRAFGNMGLVREDGGLRPAFDTWATFHRREPR